MEENTWVFRHWDDVVFENRNKNYGAYLLRQAYAQRLLTGLGITIALVAFLLVSRDLFPSDLVPPPIISRTFDGELRFTPPPVFKKQEPPQRTVQQRKTTSQNRPVLVTTADVVQTDEEFVDELILDEGTDIGAVGTLEGIGTVSVADVKPIVVPKVMDIAEVMPHYEGGLEAMMKFIQKKIRYPATPRRLGIDGTVYVRFVVNGNGSVSDVEVIKGVHPDYDREAMRVISLLPSWKGGRHNGMPVSVRMVLPIKFNLQR